MKRDFAVSFVGHGIVIGAIALLTSGRVARDTRRPAVLTVQVISSGSPLPRQETKGTTVVEEKPKSQAKSPAKPKPEQPKSGSTFKKQGLGARIEGADALGYSYYLNVVLNRIAENWFDPLAGVARTVTATVVFVIERDGTVKDVKIEKRSRDADYDAAAERALLVLDRLPPLPPEFPGPRLKLHLEFEHKP